MTSGNQVRICISLLLGLLFPVTWAYPQQLSQVLSNGQPAQFQPQGQQTHFSSQETENAYLPQSSVPLTSQGQIQNQGQGQLVQHQSQPSIATVNHQQPQFQSQEILNLTPPVLPSSLQVQNGPSEGPSSLEISQDSYANYRQLQPSSQTSPPASPGGSGPNIAAALVNSNEYGETVPGEFSSFQSYASYHNNPTA